jgi:3-oxoacyl-[acyl-carrier protein] reductase
MARYPDLQGKTVVITGGAEGIGRSAALLFSRQGANLFVADINAEKGQAVAEEIVKGGGRCQFVQTDVTSVEQIAALGNAVKQAGKLAVLVNSAGGFPKYDAVPTAELSPKDWDCGLRLNLSSQFYCCREMAGLLAENGGGAIINVSSLAARTALKGVPGYYAVAKAGVEELTRVLALELGPAIRVNAIAPGTTLSPRIIRARTPEQLAALGKQTVRGRYAEPEEIASVIVFLASEEAAHITGVTLDVNGGQFIV